MIDADVQGTLIMALDAEPGRAEDAEKERQRWWRQFGKPYWRSAAFRRKGPPEDPDKPLRIGYVSGDFKLHSCASIFGPVIATHSADYVPVLYSNTPHEQYDTNTRNFMNYEWHDVSEYSDEEFELLILRHNIDILVDLSGYSKLNRLKVFARKPAPVQVSAWGYAMPLGWPVGVVDAMFGDPIVVSEAIRKSATEKIIDLPCFVGYGVAWSPGKITPLPCLTQPPTFGAFHQVRKLNDAVLTLWHHLLDRVPDARILFKGPDFTSRIQHWIRSFLGDAAVFLPQSMHLEHLLALRQIDVMLDPFPQNGCVTCIEALSMGVPSITLIGETMVQRAAASILTAVGLPECIAKTPDEYIEKVSHLVTDGRDALRQLRQNMRERLLQSVLFNGYTQAVEAAYRSLWHRYCCLEPALAFASNCDPGDEINYAK